MWRHLAVIAFTMIGAGVAGCASEDPTAGESGTRGLSFSSALTEARAGGADQTQLAILAKGEVGFADYEAAMSRALQCMRDAGISVLNPVAEDNSGIVFLNYSWSPDVPGLTEDQGTALGDDCLTRYSYWVELEWQVQPSSVEAQESFFDGYRTAIVNCIRGNGGTVRNDATRDEAVSVAITVRDKTGVNCFQEAGISW